MCRLEADSVCAKSVRPERQTFAERGRSDEGFPDKLTLGGGMDAVLGDGQLPG